MSHKVRDFNQIHGKFTEFDQILMYTKGSHSHQSA